LLNSLITFLSVVPNTQHKITQQHQQPLTWSWHNYIPGFLKLIMQRPKTEDTHKHTVTDINTEAGSDTM